MEHPQPDTQSGQNLTVNIKPMRKFTYVVLTDPVPGKEDEYNQWYDQQHLPDVLAIDGIESAQRYRLVDGQKGVPHRYLALYHLDTDDPEKVLAQLSERSNTPAMPMSDALDGANLSAWLFEEISAEQNAKRR